MIKIIYSQFILLIGNNAVDLFDYYGVDQMHGVSRTECIAKIADGDLYIEGFANYDPRDSTLSTDLPPFIFINKSALRGTFRDVTLVNHEMMHMSLLLHDWDITKKEEEIISWAERWTNYIYLQNFYGYERKR